MDISTRLTIYVDHYSRLCWNLLAPRTMGPCLRSLAVVDSGNRQLSVYFAVGTNVRPSGIRRTLLGCWVPVMECPPQEWWRHRWRRVFKCASDSFISGPPIVIFRQWGRFSDERWLELINEQMGNGPLRSFGYHTESIILEFWHYNWRNYQNKSFVY